MTDYVNPAIQADFEELNEVGVSVNEAAEAVENF